MIKSMIKTESNRDQSWIETGMYGTKSWWLNDQLHRLDGPAIETTSGYKEWRLNGQLHRTDGPAVERTNGYKSWYINGERHRTDGPAIERKDGSKSRWINGQYYGDGDTPPTDYTLATLILEGLPQ